jgi:hypothetical protein
MKKFAIPFALLILVLAGCTPDYPDDLAIYDFDTVLVQYELSGQTEGDATLYMRGDQKALYKSVRVAGTEKNTLDLDLGDKAYAVDMDKATASELPTTDYEALKGLSAEEQNKYLVKKALGIKNSAEDPQVATTKTVAGQTCDLYIVTNIGTACIWNGIVLEKEVNIADVTNQMVATRVETDISIQPEKFEIPANVILK